MRMRVKAKGQPRVSSSGPCSTPFKTGSLTGTHQFDRQGAVILPSPPPCAVTVKVCTTPHIRLSQTSAFLTEAPHPHPDTKTHSLVTLGRTSELLFGEVLEKGKHLQGLGSLLIIVMATG